MSIAESIQKLMATRELPDLGPGPRKDVEPVAALNRELDGVLGKGKTQSLELARALVLLWHDHLEEAHVIAQGVEGPDGAFVHGIMHRREPDYGNAKYWFRRVGEHPAFPEIARRVAASGATGSDAKTLARGGKWDPFAFVDACERAARGGTAEEKGFLRAAQRIETDALIEFLVGEL